MSLSLNIDKSKLNPAFLEQYERKMKRDLKVLVKNASDYAKTEAQGMAPVKTGTLRESIDMILLNDSDFWIGSKVGYAGSRNDMAKWISLLYSRDEGQGADEVYILDPKYRKANELEVKAYNAGWRP